MLANVLALAVGLGSLALYLVAFFFPEVHRKNDFIWSGVGLFYALILWFCAGRITGAVLLGQMAGVALLGWFGWQTVTLRRQLTPALEQTKISTKQSPAEKSAKLTNPFTKKKDKTQKPSTAVTQIPPTPESDITETATATATETVITEPAATSIQETEIPTTPDLTEEVKPVARETEFISSQTTSDSGSDPVTAESEAEQTVAETTSPVTEAETNNEIPETTTTQTTQTTSPQTASAKKGGGLAQLLTPVSGILNNIKNAIQARGSKKTDSGSKVTSPEAEKSTSIEEITFEVDEPVTKIQENQPQEESESVIETENTSVSDIQTEEATFVVEIEEKTNPLSETESISISVEEVTPEIKADAEEVGTVEDSLESSKTESASPAEITAQDSGGEKEKSEPVSSEQKIETDDLPLESLKEKTEKSDD